jgi:hypothetical protein
MKFTAEHEFPAPPLAVLDVLCDPAFQSTLELPDLSLPEVVDSTPTGAQRVLKLRYEFVGHLDPIAKKVIGSRKLTWVQELEIDEATLRGSLSFVAESQPDRVRGQADIVLEAVGDAAARRRISGDLSVKIPLVGGRAERAIVPGLLRRLDVEAAATTARLRAQG